MKIQTIIMLAAMAVCSCGDAVNSNSAKGSNANSANSTANASTAKTAETPAAVLEPTTMSASDLTGVYHKADEGRIVTVSGGQLEEIGYSSLRISSINGSFECMGSFSEYQDMKTRIDDLRYKHRSPTVTVKGTYTTSSYSSDRPALKNCILTDLQR